MLFSGQITIPAGTTLDSPEIVSLTLTKGVIYRISCFFPPGNNCFAYVTFNRSNSQFYPLRNDYFIKGNDIMIDGELFYYMDTAPYTVDVFGFSPDATFDHTIWFYIWMKQPWQFNPFSDTFYQLSLQDSLPTVPEVEG